MYNFTYLAYPFMSLSGWDPDLFTWKKIRKSWIMHLEKDNIHYFPLKLRYRPKTSSENLISMHLILVSFKGSIVIIEDPKKNYILNDKYRHIYC